MPPEVEIHADPEVWAQVPSSIDDALAWVERQVARGPEAARERIAAAARLALLTAAGGDLSVGLFLCVPEAELYGLLVIAVLANVPA
ncbi:MAG: hypothetical protein WBX17_08370, partial [Microbacterium sp.]